MKIHRDLQQGSLEWAQFRAGKVTASELDALVTPLGKVKTGDGPKTYMMKKLAEAWTGGALPSVQGIWDMDQGHILEEYARPAVTLETGLQIETVGFITGDDERVGCSPDGLVAGGELGLEIKSPRIERHIEYLLGGEVPSDYILQVQGSMFVTGFSEWMFCSYCRRMPLLVLRVKRDPKIQKSISEALSLFWESFDDAWEMLVKINGGAPTCKPVPILSPEPIRFSWETQTDGATMDLMP